MSSRFIWLTPHPEAFLSYLRLSIYMSIVAVAIVVSFHLRKTASEIELRMAKPLGAVFWALSVSCLGVGIANYTSKCLSLISVCVHGWVCGREVHSLTAIVWRFAETVNKYSRRAAIVQSGWKTQTVSLSLILAFQTRSYLSSLTLSLNVGHGDDSNVYFRVLCDAVGCQQAQ